MLSDPNISMFDLALIHDLGPMEFPVYLYFQRDDDSIVYDTDCSSDGMEEDYALQVQGGEGTRALARARRSQPRGETDVDLQHESDMDGAGSQR